MQARQRASASSTSLSHHSCERAGSDACHGGPTAWNDLITSTDSAECFTIGDLVTVRWSAAAAMPHAAP
jgi:hypothetical protein